MKKTVKLPERLKAIADLIDSKAVVADIGTDHGLLPVYLAHTESAAQIIGVDVSAGSLESAKRNAAKYGVSGKIALINAFGLDFPGASDINTIVIAGVGGETMIKILIDAPWAAAAHKEGKLKLILQPQTKLDVLKDFLQNTGYTVNKEVTVTDRGRKYTILVI